VQAAVPGLTGSFQVETALACLEQIGKLNKPGRDSLETADLIEAGALALKRGPSYNDPLDSLEHSYYENALLYAQTNHNCGHIFYKDATASGLQVLSIFLGCENEEVEKNLNLSDVGVWYDTYGYLIKLLHLNGLIPPELKSFFTRKILKKTFMLINYGGTLYKCEREFLASLDKSIPTEVVKRLVETHSRCYKFLCKAFDGNLLFKKSSSSLLAFLSSGEGGLSKELANSSGKLKSAR
jgi:hypothetical protein